MKEKISYQEKAKNLAHEIMPAESKKISEEVNSIVIRPEDRDMEGRLLVKPGGPASNLPEHEWKVVRTDSFKKWFGKSKIIDESGEPMLMYHGSSRDFGAFSKDVEKNFHIASKQLELCHFFTSDPMMANGEYGHFKFNELLDLFLYIGKNYFSEFQPGTIHIEKEIFSFWNEFVDALGTKEIIIKNNKNGQPDVIVYKGKPFSLYDEFIVLFDNNFPKNSDFEEVEMWGAKVKLPRKNFFPRLYRCFIKSDDPEPVVEGGDTNMDDAFDRGIKAAAHSNKDGVVVKHASDEGGVGYATAIFNSNQAFISSVEKLDIEADAAYRRATTAGAKRDKFKKIK